MLRHTRESRSASKSIRGVRLRSLKKGRASTWEVRACPGQALRITQPERLISQASAVAPAATAIRSGTSGPGVGIAVLTSSAMTWKNGGAGITPITTLAGTASASRTRVATPIAATDAWAAESRIPVLIDTRIPRPARPTVRARTR